MLKTYALWSAIAIGLVIGAFSFGRVYEKQLSAERAKTAIEKQMRVRSENELEVRKMGDVARCAAIGGRLHKNGECR